MKFILDTDIGPDCDDAAALALAVLYTRTSGDELLAVTHCTSSPWGAGAARAILNWYGLPQLPVGTLKDEGFLVGPECERYNRALAESVSPAEREAEDSVVLLRRQLAAQPDGSVEFVSIGPLRNLANLLSSAGDELSPLTGRELVRQKVTRLTLMAGNFTPGCDTPEWNVQMDIPSARLIASEWPGEMVYCGFEVGLQVHTLPEPCPLPEEHPVRRAYLLHSGGKGRYSWDLCTVQWAMDAHHENYALSPAGVVDIDERGVTHWRPQDDGRHRYLILRASPEQAARDLERPLLSGQCPHPEATGRQGLHPEATAQ